MTESICWIELSMKYGAMLFQGWDKILFQLTIGTIVQVLVKHSYYKVTIEKRRRTGRKNEAVIAVSEFVMVVTWRRKKSMQQMSRIAGDPSEKTVVGLGTYDAESRSRCWTKTETNRAAQECLKTRLVFRICEAPPGRRSVRQPGNDCGLEHELERVRRTTVLSQRAQGTQGLHTCCQQMVNVIGEWESSTDGHTQNLYWVDSLEAWNRWRRNGYRSLASRCNENNFNRIWTIQIHIHIHLC